jgi:GGDEF domain-containing protein
MNPIYLLLINIFGVFLVINESILIEKANKFKVVILFITLTVSFGAITLYETINANQTFYTIYNTFVMLNLIVFALELFLTFRISSLRGSYYHIFIKTLKELNTNVHLIVDENERIKEISDSLLHDMGMSKNQVLDKKYIDIVNRSLQFQSMDEQSIDNNYIEQYYLRYVATNSQQEKRIIEFEYLNIAGQKEVIHVIERPIFINSKYRGRIMVGDKVTHTDLVKSREDYENVKKDFLDLQNRFQTTLSLTQEGLFFLTESTNEIWGTDRYKEMFKLDSNITTLDHIKEGINPNDVRTYEQQMKIKGSKGSYKASFRYRIGEMDKWMIEEGRKIETEDGDLTIGIVKEVDTRTGVKPISFLDEVDYKVNVKRLITEKKQFWVLRFDINKMNEYNAKYGREIASHSLNEYLKKLKRNYDNDKSMMFELSRTEYAIILTDPVDFSIVKKSMLSNSDLLIYKALMGGIEVSIQPSIGIVEFPKDTGDYDDLIASAEKTVSIAAKDFNKHYFCFYEEIRDVF